MCSTVCRISSKNIIFRVPNIFGILFGKNLELKAHLHGSNLCGVLECQYLEKHGPKIQDYTISCNSNITSLIFYSTEYY